VPQLWRRPTPNAGRSTPNADAVNPQRPLGPSSYEVERSNYEVDAYACGAAQENPPTPAVCEVPVNDSDRRLKIYEWEDWWGYRVGKLVDNDDIPEDRPDNNCGRDSHKKLRNPAPGCQPCAAAAKTAAAWQAAYDEWYADCCDKRQAIKNCGDCDLDGHQFDDDGSMRWCDHQAAREAAAAAEQAAAAAEAAAAESSAHVFNAVAGKYYDTELAARAANLVVETMRAISEKTGETPTLQEAISAGLSMAADWQAEQAAAEAAAEAEAAEEAELAAYDLQCEIDCTQCGDRGRKIGDSLILDDDGTPLALVFPPGRMPDWDDNLECHRMPVGSITVEYAHVFCDHREDNNAFTIDCYKREYGAIVMSLPEVGMGGNGLRPLPPDAVPEAVEARFAAALPAAVAETVDAELVDVEPVDHLAINGSDIVFPPESGGLSAGHEVSGTSS
jgi:hypothetical protein